MSSKQAFTELEQITKSLHTLCGDLIEVIDNQIDAVVSSNGEDIEKHIEEYTRLKSTFEEQEYNFKHHLQTMLETAGLNNVEVRLEHLKEAFPESASVINEWQEGLENQMGILKKKHQKLSSLLEFAVENNMQMIHSIYSLNNKKNIRYSAEGSKEEISSGIALNKEA